MALERVRRLNSRQRKAQVAAATEILVKEAQRIAKEEGIPYEDAVTQVLKDQGQQTRAHAMVAPVESYPRDWKPPS